MKMLAAYLERAHLLERLANAEENPRLKRDLEEQAQAYYRLAAQRAEQLNLPIPPEKAPPSN